MRSGFGDLMPRGHESMETASTHYGCWSILGQAKPSADNWARVLCKCSACGKTRAFGLKYLRHKSPRCDKCRLISERECPPPELVCKKCEVAKPVDEFTKHKGCRYGRQSRCKSCRAIESESHYRANSGRKRETQRAWRERNPDNYAKRSRERHLLNAYGISSEAYEELHAAQNGVCALCGKAETKKSKNGNLLRLAVDHCHETGKVRGLLCCTCNSGIGLIGDTREMALAAVKYLEKTYEQF